jgi:hypothetical protein
MGETPCNDLTFLTISGRGGYMVKTVTKLQREIPATAFPM